LELTQKPRAKNEIKSMWEAFIRVRIAFIMSACLGFVIELNEPAIYIYKSSIDCYSLGYLFNGSFLMQKRPTVK
jgi:hypothetical protein